MRLDIYGLQLNINILFSKEKTIHYSHMLLNIRVILIFYFNFSTTTNNLNDRTHTFKINKKKTFKKKEGRTVKKRGPSKFHLYIKLVIFWNIRYPMNPIVDKYKQAKFLWAFLNNIIILKNII